MSIHYNELFTKTFRDNGYSVVYQPSCLINNYDQQCWPIKFPEVVWKDNTLVVMHCQDFVSIRNGRCPELDAIEQHFGERSNQVAVVVMNIDLQSVYSGPLHIIHFPTHSYELFVNLRQQKDQWIHNFNVTRDNVYQCLNGIPRRHRIQVVEYLQQNYDIPNKFISLGEKVKLPEYDYSTYYGCENETNWMRLQYVYTTSVLNIITETQYTECPGVISEKTLFAFLAQQIPIVIGYQGIVDHCEGLGFDMFRDVVDTSYDYLPDTDRWRSAIDLNKQLLLCQKPIPDVEQRLKNNLQKILDLPDMLVERFFNTVQANFASPYKG